MAVTVINLSDPVSTLVTKTNNISSDVGDIAQLVTGDDNVVDAINALRAIVVPFDDSSEIISISRGGISINNDSALGLSLAYNNTTGVIKLVGAADGDTVKGYFASDSANGIGFNFGEGKFSIITSGVIEAKIASNAVTVNKIASNAVIEAKIASSAVTEAKIASSAVTVNKIANTSITSSKFNGTVSLIIYNDAGTPVKTIYSPGS